MINTDAAEAKVLESFAKAKRVLRNLVESYNIEKQKERWFLKALVAAADDGGADLVAKYKRIRIGSACN